MRIPLQATFVVLFAVGMVSGVNGQDRSATSGVAGGHCPARNQGGRLRITDMETGA